MSVAKIRVLVVDDSNFMRKAIANLLARDPGIEVVGKARSGEEALDLIPQVDPDVVTLDLEMRGLSGLETLERIMAEFPRPVLMLSAYTREGAEVTLEALRRGAVDFLEKPSGVVSLDMHMVAQHLIDKIKIAKRSTPRRPAMVSPVTSLPPPDLRPARPPAPRPARRSRRLGNPAESVLVVAASTGGVQALQVVLGGLPANWPLPTIVVQHMPPHFTQSLAADMNRALPLRVVEAEDGMLLEKGTIYIAPGGLHTLVAPAHHNPGRQTIRLSEAPTETFLRPAADVTMLAAADVFGENAIGVVLTGMGTDGALGLKAMHDRGAITFAQDRETSVIYGMPKAAAEAGAVDEVLALDQIAPACRSAVGLD
ncbi:MAG: chemotaxis response regulator protein-glutamate methylesterase [Bdellovibrionota bacterium]